MALTIDELRCPQNHRCPLIPICPVGAISQQGDGLPAIDPQECIECGKCIRHCGRNLERQYGICLNEGMTLCSLSKAGRLSCGELSDLLGLTPSNMSKVLRSVEEKEFVRRELGTADKRQMYFSLTDRGRQLLASIDCGKIETPNPITALLQK